ncbi:hypothetical protein ACFL06_00130 [Patescibacteria group bacterium]
MTQFLKKTKKLVISSFLPILASLLIVVAGIYAWDTPDDTPPDANVPAPINVGSVDQFKLYIDGSNVGRLGAATDGIDTNYGLTVGGGSNLGIKVTGDSLLEDTVIIGGKVGIGTSNPAYEIGPPLAEIEYSASEWNKNVLHVSNDGGPGVFILEGTTTARIHMVDSEADNQSFILQYDKDPVNGPFEDTFLIGTFASGSVFPTHEIMIMEANGNVGIGKDPTFALFNPEYRLDVGGPIRLRESTQPVTPADGLMYYNATTGFQCYEEGEWKNCIGSGGSGGQYLFETVNANGISLTAESTTDTLNLALVAGSGLTLDGNAGNDTATFGVDFTLIQERVTGDCVVGQAIRVIDQDGGVTCQAVGGGGLWLDNVAGGYIYPDNYNNIAITDAGRVGIGTTNPDTTLHVAGHLQIGDAGVARKSFEVNNSTGSVYVGSQTQSGEIYVRNSGGTTVGFIGSGATTYFTNDVGIGTDAPSQRLEVNGVAQAATFYASTGVSTYDTSVTSGTVEATRFCLDNDDNNNTNCVDTSWPSGGLSGGLDGRVTLWDAADSITYDSLYWDFTNNRLGVGNSSPNYTIDIISEGTIHLNDGDLRSVHALYLKDWDDNTGGTDDKYRLLARDGSWMFYNGGVVVGSYGNGQWTDLVDGYLIVEDRIGVREVSPQAAFHVDGTVRFEDHQSCTALETDSDGDLLCGTDDGGSGGIDGSGAANRLTIWEDNDTVKSDANLTWIDGDDRLSIGGASAGLWINNDASDWFLGRSGANFRIYYGSDRFGIDTSGNITIPGLVNCDTIDTNASGTLACGTDDGGSGGIDGSGAANRVTYWLDGDTVTSSADFTWSSSDGLIVNPTAIDESVRLGSFWSRPGVYSTHELQLFSDNVDSSTGGIIFGHDNSERMRLTGTGNLGIGTTSPDYRLQVDGSSNASIKVNATNANDAFLRLTEESGSDYGAYISYDGGENELRIGTIDNNNLVPVIRVDRNERFIGIGQNTDPNHMLDIHAVGTDPRPLINLEDGRGIATGGGIKFTMGAPDEGAGTYDVFLVQDHDDALWLAGGGLYIGGGAGAPAMGFGDLVITGNLSKGSGSFLIDHPLDPLNKVLRHSFVESPDMKNIYDGVIVLNESGEAIVQLPDYFEALNMEFRYQLTAIGEPAAGLYVKKEIQDNYFTIAGGVPRQKISWQVTGTRQDAYAKENPIIVEEEKDPSQKGTYIHPDVFK